MFKISIPSRVTAFKIIETKLEYCFKSSKVVTNHVLAPLGVPHWHALIVVTIRMYISHSDFIPSYFVPKIKFELYIYGTIVGTK